MLKIIFQKKNRIEKAPFFSTLALGSVDLAIIFKNIWLSFLTLILFKKNKNNPKRIIIYKIGNIGDITCAMPSLLAIRRAYPSSHITLLTSPGEKGAVGASELLGKVWFIDELKTYHTNDVQSLKGIYKIISELRKEKTDIFIQLPDDLVSFRVLLRNLIFAKIIGAKFAFGFTVRTSQLFKKTQIKYLRDETETESLINLLRENGVFTKKIEFNFGDTTGEKEKISSILFSKWPNYKKELIVAISPGGKRETNRWPAEKYKTVVENLVSVHKAKIVILGNHTEEYLAKYIVSGLDKEDCLIATGNLNLLEVVEILKCCTVLISNSTGTIHLAAATGIKIIGIYGPRDVYGRWFPYGRGHHILYDEAPCDPNNELCVQKKIAKIKTSSVLESCDSLIKGRPLPPRKFKLAALTSHPIQYQAPFFAEVAKNPATDLQVFFSYNPALIGYHDKEFGQNIKWDIPLFQGYQYEFLDNLSSKPSSNFWGQINISIIRKLKNEKYNAILVHGWNSFTNWLVFFTAPLFNTEIFLRGENPLNQETTKPKFKKFFKKFILQWLFKRVSKILYIGEENKKFYLYYGAPENKLIFCPYAIDNSRFIDQAEKLLPRKTAIRNAIGFNPEHVIFLFIGKLISKKRPFDLLRAYEQVKSDKKTLIFIGDGPLRDDLETYVRDHSMTSVYFQGFKNQTELPEYYALADVLVLPSGSGETWGLVVNEAECFKLAIVVSAIIGCASDLVKNGENGFIFETGNINALASSLNALIADREKIKKFGEKSFKIVSQYNFKKDAEAIFDTPLVSICIPVYNGGELLKRALSSCLSQTYKNIEIIVVDNASTDNTIETVKDFQSRDARIKFFQNKENIGSLKNFLRAFSLASGEFVQILCHDDWLSKNYVEEAVKIFNIHPDVGAVFSKIPSFMEGKDGNLSFILEVSFPSGKYPSDYFFKNRFKNQIGANDVIAMMKRKEVISASSLVLKVLKNEKYDNLYRSGHAVDQLIMPQVLLCYPYFFFTNHSSYVKIGRPTSVGQEIQEKFNLPILLDAYRVCHEYLYKNKLKKYLKHFRVSLGSKLLADKFFLSVKNIFFHHPVGIVSKKEIKWFFRDYSFSEKLFSVLSTLTLITKRALIFPFRKLENKIKNKPHFPKEFFPDIIIKD